MALSSRSVFRYGYEINQYNSSLDFRSVMGGPILQATLNTGYYSLASLLREVARAMNAVDPANTYAAGADRTYSGGLETRVTITASTSGYLDLLFGSGPRSTSSCGPLLGFALVDRTGALHYVSQGSSGISFSPSLTGYNYLDPEFQQKQFGAVNVSSSGQKEAVVFQTQRFINVQFKYEPKTYAKFYWTPFMQWATKQRLFEFTPETTNPSTFYEVTLERTPADGKGLAYAFKEMLPDFPNYYDIGNIQMRINEVA